MPSILTQRQFSAADLPLVENFFCGDEPSALAATAWIRGTTGRCAIVSMAERGTEVWLYFTDNGLVVGFAALGTTIWPPGETHSILVQMAVHSDFQKLPIGEG